MNAYGRGRLKAQNAIRSRRVGRHIWDLDGASLEEAKKEIAALKNRPGSVRVNPDGSREWNIREIVEDPSKQGMEAYTWDLTGHKVKMKSFLVKKSKEGIITKTFIGSSWETF